MYYNVLAVVNYNQWRRAVTKQRRIDGELNTGTKRVRLRFGIKLMLPDIAPVQQFGVFMQHPRSG